MADRVPYFGSTDMPLYGQLAQSDAAQSAARLEAMTKAAGDVRTAQTTAAGNMGVASLNNADDLAGIYGGDRLASLIAATGGGAGIGGISLPSSYSAGADQRRIGSEDAKRVKDLALASQYAPDQRIGLDSLNNNATNPGDPVQFENYYTLKDRTAASRGGGGGRGAKTSAPKYGWLVSDDPSLAPYPIDDEETYLRIRRRDPSLRIDERYYANPVITMDPSNYRVGASSGGTDPVPITADDEVTTETPEAAIRDLIERYPDDFNEETLVPGSRADTVKVQDENGDWEEHKISHVREVYR